MKWLFRKISFGVQTVGRTDKVNNFLRYNKIWLSHLINS